MLYKYTEGGFGRLSQIMRGQVPTIETFGIITAQNPNAEKASPEKNKLYNQKLEHTLKRANYGFHRIGGMYGIKEDSYFIPNITKDEILKLGKDFNQESIIYGEKEYDDDGEPYMMMYMVKSDTSKILDSWPIFSVDPKDPEGKPVSDYYSTYPRVEPKDKEYKKGKTKPKPPTKFNIPFFSDDEMRNKSFNKGYRGQSESLSYLKNSFPQEFDVLIDEMNDCYKESLNENKTPKYRWEKRGEAKIILNELLKELKDNTNIEFYKSDETDDYYVIVNNEEKNVNDCERGMLADILAVLGAGSGDKLKDKPRKELISILKSYIDEDFEFNKKPDDIKYDIRVGADINKETIERILVLLDSMDRNNIKMFNYFKEDLMERLGKNYTKIVKKHGDPRKDGFNEVMNRWKSDLKPFKESKHFKNKKFYKKREDLIKEIRE